MSAPDLAALRAAAERATQGPWTHQSLEPLTYGHDWVDRPERRKLAFCGGVVGNDPHGYCDVVPCEEISANAAYIAAANPATTLYLLDRIAALEVALQGIANWRRDCHRYDADMGHDLRDFGIDDMSMMEACARAALEPGA